MERKNVCAYFLATMPLLRYFKPIKDDSSNVCKGAIFVVLGASEKEAIEVAAELKRIAAQSIEDLVGKNQEFSMQRKTRSTSLATLARMEIDRLFKHFAHEFLKLNESRVGHRRSNNRYKKCHWCQTWKNYPSII